MHSSSEIVTLPASARLNYIRDVLKRELNMRQRVLKGADRATKVKEMETCLEYLAHVDQALSKARGVVEAHKQCEKAELQKMLLGEA